MPDLHDAFVAQLEDLYSAEKQITEALPKMVDAAAEDDLRRAFEHHLEETRGHVERLERIFDTLDVRPGTKTCEGMEGLLKEGEEAIGEHGVGPVRDALLIAGAQRVEHYEIAGYGTVVTWAEEMGHDEVADLLEETLEEESSADEKLTKIAEGGLLGGGVNEAAKSAARAD